MANISINLYDGAFDAAFDCSGAITCKYALWELMPIDDDEHCAHRYCGSCRSSDAQIAALNRVRRRIGQEISKLSKQHFDEFFED